MQACVFGCGWGGVGVRAGNQDGNSGLHPASMQPAERCYQGMQWWVCLGCGENLGQCAQKSSVGRGGGGMDAEGV